MTASISTAESKDIGTMMAILRETVPEVLYSLSFDIFSLTAIIEQGCAGRRITLAAGSSELLR
jgi:hypothetical protein